MYLVLLLNIGLVVFIVRITVSAII